MKIENKNDHQLPELETPVEIKEADQLTTGVGGEDTKDWNFGHRSMMSA